MEAELYVSEVSVEEATAQDLDIFRRTLLRRIIKRSILLTSSFCHCSCDKDDSAFSCGASFFEEMRGQQFFIPYAAMYIRFLGVTKSITYGSVGQAVGR